MGAGLRCAGGGSRRCALGARQRPERRRAPSNGGGWRLRTTGRANASLVHVRPRRAPKGCIVRVETASPRQSALPATAMLRSEVTGCCPLSRTPKGRQPGLARLHTRARLLAGTRGRGHAGAGSGRQSARRFLGQPVQPPSQARRLLEREHHSVHGGRPLSLPAGCRAPATFVAVPRLLGGAPHESVFKMAESLARARFSPGTRHLSEAGEGLACPSNAGACQSALAENGEPGCRQRAAG